MAEDLSIKVKVDPDVSGVQEKLNKSNKLKLNVKVDLDQSSDIQKQLDKIANKKFQVKVSMVPDANDLQNRLNQISKNLKLNLKLVDDGDITKQLDNISTKFQSSASAMQNTMNSKVNSGFKVTAKTIASLSGAFGELENKISKVGDSASKTKLESQFSSLKKQYDTFLGSGNSSSVDFSNIQQGLSNIKAECNSVIEAEKRLTEAQEEAGKAALESANKAADAMKRQASAADALYERLKAGKKEIPSGLDSLVDSDIYGNMNSAFDNAEKAKTLYSLNGSEENLKAYQKSLSDLVVSVKAYNEELTNANSKAKSDFGSLSKYTAELNSKINSLKQAYSSKSGMQDSGVENTIAEMEKAMAKIQWLNTSFANGITDYNGVVSLFKDMEDSAQKAGIPIRSMSDLMRALDVNYQNAFNSVRTFSQELKNTQSINSLQKRLSNLQYTLTRYVETNKKIQGNEELFGKYNSISSSISSALKTGDVVEMTKAINKQSAAVSDLKKRTQELGLEGKTLSQVFQDLFGQHFNTMVAMAALHLMQDSLRQVYQNVLDIDTAMTELKKVTDETSASYEAFLNRSADTAKQLGADVSDLINTTADWARLGYSVDESEELAKVSTLYKNVGDSIESASQASEYLISTLKGFNMDASDAQHILDVINAVSNTQPVSAQDLGEIMQRSSAAMSAANNTMEETIALATAMNSVLQDSAKTGTTLKTVSMYLRATDTELEQAGESTEGMAESTSKLRQELLALTHGKVDIQLDEDTYKSTYQILKEMSYAWDDMTDKEHAAALELMGGKRNANAVQAVIQQFQIAEESLETAQNSAGSAMKENDKYMNSIQGKLTKFQATFEVLSNDLLDSDLVKGVVDLGTGALNAVDGFVKLAGAIPAVTTALAALISMSNIDTSGNKVKMFSYAVEIAA